MNEFEGKKVIIIGGSRGIGLSAAMLFADRGAAVAVGARNPASLAQTAALLKEKGNVHHVAECDITDVESLRNFIDGATRAMGGLDILVNCASSFAREDSEDSWESAIQVDLLGTVRAIKAAVPHMRESGGGSIVNVSSVGARQAQPRRLPYGAVKAAIEQHTKSAAKFYAPDKIRINCVVPGSTYAADGIWEEMRQTDFATYQATIASIPLGGLADPESIAEGILFLASDRARWVTGQCLVVDGGQTAGIAA